MGSPAATTVDSSRSAGHAAAPRRRSRRLPRVVWAVVLLQAALTLGTMVLYPTFQNPDEYSHVDYVLAHRHGDWIYAPGARSYQDGVVRAKSSMPYTQFRSHVGGQLADHSALRPANPRDQRLSFDQLGRQPLTDNPPNQMVQHPFLYYGVAAGLSYLVPNFSHQHFDVQVFWLRMISLLLLLPVPILIFLTGRRLTGSQTVGLVAALIPLSIPGYIRTGASVTNDSMAVLLGTLLLYLLARVAAGDLSRSTAVWAGLAWAGALLTKGLALALPPVIAAVYLLGASGALRDRVRRAWLPALLCGAVGTAVGGWWWIRNYVVYGVVQPNGLGPVYSKDQFGPDRPGGTELKFVGNFVRLFGKRVWGSLGLIDKPEMPVFIPVTIVIAFLGLVGVGIAGGMRRSTAPRWAAAVFVLPVVVTLGALYAGTRHWYLHTTQLPGLQARYLYPVFAGIAVVAAVGLRRVTGRLWRYLPITIAVFAVVFQLAAAAVVLDVEMSPDEPGLWNRMRDGLRYVLSWAPWPTPATEGLLAVAVAAALVALYVLVRANTVGARNWQPATRVFFAGGESGPEPNSGLRSPHRLERGHDVAVSSPGAVPERGRDPSPGAEVDSQADPRDRRDHCPDHRRRFDRPDG